jgi:hypothetical protein
MAMSKNAYCSGCGSRVQLTDAAECPNGHPRSMLRDVQEGLAVPAPRPVAVVDDEGASNLKPSEEAAAKLIGQLIIIVPAAIVLVFAIWSSYAISIALGFSKTASWLSSIGDLLLVGAGVWFVVWNRRRKMGR